MIKVMYENAGQAIIFSTMALPPQDENALIHRAWVVTDFVDEHENNVNHMPRSSQSPDLNTIEHL